MGLALLDLLVWGALSTPPNPVANELMEIRSHVVAGITPARAAAPAAKETPVKSGARH